MCFFVDDCLLIQANIGARTGDPVGVFDISIAGSDIYGRFLPSKIISLVSSIETDG
jgi:hypothetical protein